MRIKPDYDEAPPFKPNKRRASDGEKSEWTNSEKADTAHEMLQHYPHFPHESYPDDIEALATDAITDICHLLHSKGINPEQVLNGAQMHWEFER